MAGFLVWSRWFGVAGLVAALWIAWSGPAVGQGAGAAQAVAGAADEPALAFDVASIRENRSSTPGNISTHVYRHDENGEFTAINLSLKELVQFAYGLPDKQILNAPGWAEQNRFDIEAKADPVVDEQIHKLNSQQAKLVKQQMVRALLAERFNLAAHA